MEVTSTSPPSPFLRVREGAPAEAVLVSAVCQPICISKWMVRKLRPPQPSLPSCVCVGEVEVPAEAVLAVSTVCWPVFISKWMIWRAWIALFLHFSALFARGGGLYGLCARRSHRRVDGLGWRTNGWCGMDGFGWLVWHGMALHGLVRYEMV